MKKLLFTYLGLLLTVALLAANTTLNIFKTDKTVLQINLDQIVRIKTQNQDSLLVVERVNGGHTSVSITEIDSITYTEDSYGLPLVQTVSVNNNVEEGKTHAVVEVVDDGGCELLERGLVWGTSVFPTLENNKYSAGQASGKFYAFLSDLDPETTYYLRGYATNCAGTAYSPTKKLEPLRGNVTYNLAVDPSAAFYDQLKQALDSACYYYNRYTTFEANIYVYYNEGIPTAQASYRGSIGFGPNTSYMWVGTVMHEMAHYFGSGTTQAWKNLMVNGVWQGAAGQALCQELTGQTLKGDGGTNPIHYWPTGINYRNEVSSVQDLIEHARIVQAMLVEDAKIPNK